MRSTKIGTWLLLVPWLAMPGTPPAAADRLLLRRGGWIETRGAWRIDGGRIVFREPGGGLRSLSIDEVAPAPSLAPAPAGSPVSLAAWPAPGAIPEVRPLPAPGAGRFAPRPLVAGCRLVTPVAGEDPILICPARSPADGPGLAHGPGDRHGAVTDGVRGRRPQE